MSSIYKEYLEKNPDAIDTDIGKFFKAELKKEQEAETALGVEATLIGQAIYSGGDFEKAVKRYRKKTDNVDIDPINKWAIGRIRQDVKREAELAEEYDIDPTDHDASQYGNQKRILVWKVMHYTAENRRVVKRPIYVQLVRPADKDDGYRFDIRTKDLEGVFEDGATLSYGTRERFSDWWYGGGVNTIIPEKVGKYLYENLQGKGKYLPTGNPMGRPKGEKKPRASRAKPGAVMGRPKKKRNPVGRPKKAPPPTEIDGLKVLTKENKGISVGVKKKFYPVKEVKAKKQLTQKQLDALANARAAKKKKNTFPVSTPAPAKPAPAKPVKKVDMKKIVRFTKGYLKGYPFKGIKNNRFNSYKEALAFVRKLPASRKPDVGGVTKVIIKGKTFYELRRGRVLTKTTTGETSHIFK